MKISSIAASAVYAMKLSITPIWATAVAVAGYFTGLTAADGDRLATAVTSVVVMKMGPTNLLHRGHTMRGDV